MGLDTAVTILLITHGRTPHQCSVIGQTGYDPTIISDNWMGVLIKYGRNQSVKTNLVTEVDCRTDTGKMNTWVSRIH